MLDWKLPCFMQPQLATPTISLGILHKTRGACPVCGRDVERRHTYNGHRLQESYGCYRCGPTTYTVRASA